MFEKLLSRFKKKKEEPVIKEESKPEYKEIDLEISCFGNFIKIDINEDCSVADYVPTMKKYGQEWVEDKIPNATLFDKGFYIKKKIIYVFDRDNISYSCYSNDDIIHINERIKTENNHIDERIIKIDKKTNNYTISRLKHDKIRSTYFTKSYSSKDPEQVYFQLGKENALLVAEELLNNLSQISGVTAFLDLDCVHKVIGIPKKETPKQVILPVKITDESTSEKVKKL